MAVAGVLGVIGVAGFATAARTIVPAGELYAVKSAAILALVMIVAAFRVSAHLADCARFFPCPIFFPAFCHPHNN